MTCVTSSSSSASSNSSSNKLSSSSLSTQSKASTSTGSEQRKLRQESDKKEIGAFLNARNLIKTFVKLLFGNNEESAATSRQVLSVLVKVLDLLRNSFTQKARNSNTALRNAVDDAGLAALTMAKGTNSFVFTFISFCLTRLINFFLFKLNRCGQKCAEP